MIIFVGLFQNLKEIYIMIKKVKQNESNGQVSLAILHQLERSWFNIWKFPYMAGSDMAVVGTDLFIMKHLLVCRL